MLPSGSFRLWTTFPRAHHVDIVGSRIVGGRVVLCGQEDALVLAQRVFQRAWTRAVR
jgi:hypothetical protein